MSQGRSKLYPVSPCKAEAIGFGLLVFYLTMMRGFVVICCVGEVWALQGILQKKYCLAEFDVNPRSNINSAFFETMLFQKLKQFCFNM
jgi:uncharacterized membrane protein HdeD (DUF308 family)